MSSSTLTVGSCTLNSSTMREKVRALLFGTCNCIGGTGGIIRKLASRSYGETFGADEDKFINASSPGILGLLHRVSSQPGSAALVGEQMVGVLATSLTNQIIDEMFKAVTDSVASTGKPLDSSMLKVMESRRQQIDNERRLNGESTASIAHILDILDDVERSLHQNGKLKI